MPQMEIMLVGGGGNINTELLKIEIFVTVMI